MVETMEKKSSLPNVQKRSGKSVRFNQNKITQAVYSCLINSCDFTEIRAKEIAGIVTTKVVQILSKSNSLNVEQIQDTVEITLMAIGEHEAAKQYILYREERRKLRTELSSIFKKRIAFKPFEYPEIMQFKDAINHSYWLVSEWNFIEDIQDFNVRMNDVERNAIKNALLAISQIEVAVKRFWARLGERFPKAEFEQVGITFAESEVRHADAYSHLLHVLGFNSAFDDLLEVPAIKNRIDYLSDTMKGVATDVDEDYVLTLALFSLFIENVSLFSQFAIIKSFNKHRGLLKDVDNVVQATQQEERIHAMLGMTIIKYIQKERPKWFNEAFWVRVNEISQRALQAESSIIDWIYEKGELPFLTKDNLKEFLKYRFNTSVAMIGGKGPFAVDQEKLNNLRWFIEEIDSEVSTDFFHKKPVTYSKKTQAITANNLF
jgi:ribonucleoside-diphosphate reductase beta chain